MTFNTLYAGQVNSPNTTLSSGIDDDDTTIPVTELGVFPAGPNLAVIGTGSTAETILYTDKSAASGSGNLTGCTRAYDSDGTYGVAASWESGEVIARNFTEHDWATIKNNAEDLNTRTEALEGGSVITWAEVTGTTQACAVECGYILNNASLVTATLPATASVGDVIRIVGKGAGMWKLAQNASQYIRFAGLTTTTGTGGYLQAETAYDCIEIMCTTANNGWTVISSIGNIEVV